jgi:hypothetical protein
MLCFMLFCIVAQVFKPTDLFIWFFLHDFGSYRWSNAADEKFNLSAERIIVAPHSSLRQLQWTTKEFYICGWNLVEN